MEQQKNQLVLEIYELLVNKNVSVLVMEEALKKALILIKEQSYFPKQNISFGEYVKLQGLVQSSQD